LAAKVRQPEIESNEYSSSRVLAPRVLAAALTRMYLLPVSKKARLSRRKRALLRAMQFHSRLIY